MIHLADLRCCECGGAEIAAVAPGTEPDGKAPAANADVGAPVVARCWRGWSARYAAGVPEPASSTPAA